MLRTKKICAADALRTARPETSAIALGLQTFWRDQTGNMSYLAIVGSLVMMVFGGVGVDMMHAELKRNKVQNTLDRAVLAAAHLKNTQDPQQVVRDYFTAMGMADALTTIDVQQSLTSKTVVATADSRISSDFMSLIGVNTLGASGLAAAEHATTNAEISLVLDVSGSMGSNSKIENLRAAATEFVDILIPPEGSRLTSISLIPYNATVNMGTQLPEYVALDRQHDFSACAEFPDTAFGETLLFPDMPLEQVGRFDPVSRSIVAGNTPRQWCRDGDNAAILPHTSDPEVLKDRISALEAWGNTAIDVGMKWGTGLLDPSSRPVTQAMSDDGLIAQYFQGRPADYTDEETGKFVVVMTDGANTTQYDLPGTLKSREAKTGIWVHTKGTDDYGDDDYSVKLQSFDRIVTDYFPAWPQDISNVVFYFDTDGDGLHDIAHKIEDFPDNGPRDLDDFAAQAVGFVMAQDSRLTDSADFLGASIKGGNETDSYHAVRYDTNAAQPDPGPILNTGSTGVTVHSYTDLDRVAYSAGSDVSMYYWTRTADDPTSRYQVAIDGLGADPQHLHELNYNELYDRFGTRAAADLLLYRPAVDGHISNQRYWTVAQPYVVKANAGTADTRLSTICDAAKAQGIVVFAIGFEAPPRGIDAMRDCASSPAHFFDVEGLELQETFAAIANTISQLRLTQ